MHLQPVLAVAESAADKSVVEMRPPHQSHKRAFAPIAGSRIIDVVECRRAVSDKSLSKVEANIVAACDIALFAVVAKIRIVDTSAAYTKFTGTLATEGKSPGKTPEVLMVNHKRGVIVFEKQFLTFMKSLSRRHCGKT